MLYLVLKSVRAWLIDHDLYWLFSVLDQIQFRALFAAFLSFILTMVMGRRTIAWLTRKKIGDTGQTDAAGLQQQATSKANTPTMGGMLILGAVLVSVLLLADLSLRYVQLGLVVIVWLGVVGLADDWLKLTAKLRGQGRQGLQEWEKLAFQLGLGLLVGWFLWTAIPPPPMVNGPAGSVQGPGATGSMGTVLNLPFQKTWVDADRLPEAGARVVEPGTQGAVDAERGQAPGRAPLPASERVAQREPVWVPNPGLYYMPMGLFVLVATLMIAGMSNAVNITDGMDGLAGGIAAAVLMGVFVLALIAGDEDAAKWLLVPHIPGAGELAVIAGATAGACLGFLWWNCWPAKVFMGDTGALALGGIIGYIALVIRQEAVVLLMSGVFLMEIASVVIQRYYFKATGGQRVFRCAPYHHHLNMGGWPEQRVVVRLWIIAIILVVLGLASIKLR